MRGTSRVLLDEAILSDDTAAQRTCLFSIHAWLRIVVPPTRYCMAAMSSFEDSSAAARLSRVIGGMGCFVIDLLFGVADARVQGKG